MEQRKKKYIHQIKIQDFLSRLRIIWEISWGLVQKLAGMVSAELTLEQGLNRCNIWKAVL